MLNRWFNSLDFGFGEDPGLVPNIYEVTSVTSVPGDSISGNAHEAQGIYPYTYNKNKSKHKIYIK